MSEWIEVGPEGVELSDDKKYVHILFETNEWGNRWIEIPVDVLKRILAEEMSANERER